MSSIEMIEQLGQEFRDRLKGKLLTHCPDVPYYVRDFLVDDIYLLHSTYENKLLRYIAESEE